MYYITAGSFQYRVLQTASFARWIVGWSEEISIYRRGDGAYSSSRSSFSVTGRHRPGVVAV